MLPLVLASLLTLGAAADPTDDPSLTALPLWQTFAMIDELTPRMRWYRVDYDQVERCSCQVGVPQDPSLEPELRCWFPGVHARDRERIPADAAAGARQAKRAVKRSSRHDHQRARRLDVHYLGTWRKLLLRDVVLRVSGPPDHAVFTSTRAAFRVDPVAGLLPLEHTAMGEQEGGTGLLCYSSECTAPGLLSWAPPPSLDGSSPLWGLTWEPDPRAAAAWPALEGAALRAVAAMDAGTWNPAAPPVRQGPGAASTAATWTITTYGPAQDGTRTSQRLLIPLDLAQAQLEPVTVHRELEPFGVHVTARFDLPADRIELSATASTGASAQGSWVLPPLGLAPHGALPGSTSLGVPYQDLQLMLGPDAIPDSLMVAADTALHPGPLPPSPAGIRLPVAAERRGDRVVWTAWEWLDPGPTRVLGLRLEACPTDDPVLGCSGQLQGGAGIPPELLVDLPPGPLAISLEVFDTDRVPDHLWQPASGDYQRLWSADFTAVPVVQP